MSSNHDQCAQAIVDTVPLIMRAIRTEMRSHRDVNLTIPQFRALLFVSRQQGSSLSRVADHLGLTSATTSRLIEGLVRQNYVQRNVVASNRRQVNITLTQPGMKMLDSALQQTRRNMSQKISGLPEKHCLSIISSMQILNEIFSSANVR